MASSSVLSFSCDGQYLVHASPSGVIKIWDTSTGKLRQEYIPSSHLSASCCCLSWCPWTNNVSNNTKKKRRSITTHQPDLIALGTTSGVILLYSYIKGDLHSQLTDGHTDRVTCTSWSIDGTTLYSSSCDHHIVEWDVPSASVRSKWKAESSAVHSVCHCAPHHLLTASQTIKLWDLKTKQVIRKFTGHATEVFSLLHTSTTTSIDDSYIVSAALDDRLVNAWHINVAVKDKRAASTFSLPDTPAMLHLSHSPSQPQTIILLVITRSGQVLFYGSPLNGGLKRSVAPSFTIHCVTSPSSNQPPAPIPIHAAVMRGDKIHIVHGNLMKPTFELVSRTMDGTDVCLVRDGAPPPPSCHEAASKVKTPLKSENVTALVPGFMTPAQTITDESLAKRKKTPLAELSMADRLSAISIDKTRDGTDTPRADSLALLLTQGLQSSDKSILNHVLQNCNEAVIMNTVRRLPIATVVPLVKELSTRMYGHAQSGMTLSRWMKTVLSVHTSYLMSFPEIVDVCSPVYQMMDCRVNMFTRLSKLQGRLNLLLSQIGDHKEADELSQQQPLLAYHEESSDDDGMLEEIINPEECLDDISDDEEDDDEEDDISDEEEEEMATG